MAWYDYLPVGSTVNLGNHDPSATRQQQRDEIANESQGAIDQEHNAPAYTGPAGQGWIDSNGNVTNTPGPGKVNMQRPGIDARVQGNLENPYAGYYGGKPGVAESEEGRYSDLANQARNAQAAKMNLGFYSSDRGLELGSRGNQQTALSKYLDLANGKGPSLAQAQANYGIAQSNAQQASIAAGARGGGANLAAAQQAASNAAGSASANVIGQATMAREKEQMDALSAYGSMATAMRANDLQRQGLSEQQAAQQAAIEETQHGINAQTGLGYEGLRKGVFEDQQQGMEYNESENQNAFMGGLGIGVQQHAQDQSQTNAAIGGATSTAATAIPLIAKLAAADEKGTPTGSGSMGWVPQGWNGTTNGSAAASTPYRQTSGASTTTTPAPQQTTMSIQSNPFNAQKPQLAPGTGTSQPAQQPTLSPYLRQPRMQQPTAPQQTLSPYLHGVQSQPSTSPTPQQPQQQATPGSNGGGGGAPRFSDLEPSPMNQRINNAIGNALSNFKMSPEQQHLRDLATPRISPYTGQPLSDVREKERIGDGHSAVQAQMASSPPYTFDYRNPDAPGAGPGRRVGVMAQDMERGPYGHQLVKNTPQGKKIDGPGALSLALASGADHEQRLRELEARANAAVGKTAREQAYDAWYAERQKSPGFRAAQAYDQRQENAPPFRNFVPESSIQTRPAPNYPTAPQGLASWLQMQDAPTSGPYAGDFSPQYKPGASGAVAIGGPSGPYLMRGGNGGQ
jgi:hypothetical protein